MNRNELARLFMKILHQPFHGNRNLTPDTHSCICMCVEISLTSCQYRATIDRSAQFSIEFGMNHGDCLPVLQDLLIPS